jgi:phosphonate transport system ATP-binding protein
MTGEAPAYQLDGVGKRYGDAEAVRDVSLSIAPGETVALVGPSGAGKTTLLRMMAGMFPPSCGGIEIAGRSAGTLRPGAELTDLVGILQQRLDLVGPLSVKHNVQAGLLGQWGVLRSLAALVSPFVHPSVQRALARVGIQEKLNTRAGNLSGGEQQRVALARLLVQDPRILLADEPVSSLDPARADDLLELLRSLAAESGRTLVASLHTPGMARRHFARVVGLRHGAVAFDLPAAEVTDDVLEDVYTLGDGLSPGELDRAHPEPAGVAEPGRHDGQAPTPSVPPAQHTAGTTTHPSGPRG